MMMTFANLPDLVETVNTYTGSWKNAPLAVDVCIFVWGRYDPNMAFIYPNIKHWDDLLQRTIDNYSYDELTKDQVLSILFGLHHRNRINDGLWFRMFTEGVTQKLLQRLLVFDTDIFD